MANQVIIDIKVPRSEIDKANESIEELTKSTVELQRENKELSKENKKLEKSFEDLDKEVKDGTKTEKQAAKEKENLTNDITKNSKKLAENKKQIQDNNRERTAAIKFVKAEAGSRNQLRQKVAQLTKEYNSINQSTKEGALRAGKLQSELKDMNKTLNEGSLSAGNFKDNIGNYSSALDNVIPGTGKFVTGIQGMTKASLKFIATPLGLILTAIVTVLASLKAAFTSSEEGQDALNKASAVFGVIMGNLMDIISDFGELLIDIFVNRKKIISDFGDTINSIFNDPKQAIIDLGDIIKDSILNRLESFGSFADGIIKIFKGEFVDGFKDIGDASIQLVTGMENGIDGITSSINGATNAMDGLIEETLREAEIAKQLADQQAALNRTERAALIERAKLQRDIAGLRIEAKDEENNTDEERLDFLRQAIALEKQILDLDLNIATQKRDIKAVQNTLSKSTKEDLDEEAQLRADVFAVEEQNLTRRRALIREEQTLLRKLNADNIDQTSEDQEKAIEDELRRIETANTKLAELDKKRQLDRIEGAEETRDLLIEIEQERISRELENEALLDEERELLRQESLDRIAEIEQDFIDNQVKQQAEMLSSFQETLDELDAISSEFTDGQSKVFTDLFSQIGNFATMQEITAKDKFAAVASFSKTLTSEIGKDNKRQLDSLSKQKEQELELAGDNSDKRLEIEQEFAEKEKELLRKQFNAEKIKALADIAINTAIAIAKAVAASPATGGLPFSAIAAGIGATQLAVVASQRPQFKKGGTIVNGKSHSLGGVDIYGSNGQYFGNVEGGEMMTVLKKDATEAIALSNLNEQFGGRRFADGGTIVNNTTNNTTQTSSVTAAELAREMSKLNIFVRVEDITTAQGLQTQVVNNATI